MPARAEGLSYPEQPFRWLLAPAVGWAFLMTLVAMVCSRVRLPSMPRMSEQWLLSHEKEFSRLDY